MTATPYATDVTPSQAVVSKGEAPFYSMSESKLAVMLVCSAGLYQVYWFYKQWACIKQRERSNIRPVMRGIFPILFGLQLGSKVDAQEEQRGLAESGRLQDFMGVWLVLSLVLNFAPDPYGFLLAMLSLVPLPLVQARINRLNAAVSGEAEPTTRFSAWNWLVIVPGTGFMALAVFGFFISLA